MDAVRFLEEKARMCESGKCPLSYTGDTQIECGCINLSNKDLVRVVDDWSKKNPVLTNRMKFGEVFGIPMEEPERKPPCAWYTNGEFSCTTYKTYICHLCPWWDEPFSEC